MIIEHVTIMTMGSYRHAYGLAACNRIEASSNDHSAYLHLARKGKSGALVNVALSRGQARELANFLSAWVDGRRDEGRDA